jgi:adenine deaminase
MDTIDQESVMNPESVAGHIVDVENRVITPGILHIRDGLVDRIEPERDVPRRFLIPGFVDAHIHVESTMLSPAEFARWAVVHGTVATVSDPHEIANVLGVDGVDYMIRNAALRPEFSILFGAPSCVPATTFETAGACLDARAVRELLARPEIGYLSEVMNVPGVLSGDPDLREKLEAARKSGKPIDGHAPGLRGEAVHKYAAAGVQTDHECSTLEEARDRLAAGMWVMIREGSAAKDFTALSPLLFESPDRLMFCSDDKHPNDLLRGHINQIAARAVALGADPFDVLRISSWNPAHHYKLNTGFLRPGDPASFAIVSDLQEFHTTATYLHGVCVAADGKPLMDHIPSATPNVFRTSVPSMETLRCAVPAGTRIDVMDVHDGSLVTGHHQVDSTHCALEGIFHCDVVRDLLKIIVVNRYSDAPPAVAVVHGFGLKRGAIASSVAHDSHNIVAVGTDDRSLIAAVEAIIHTGGGVAVASGAREVEVLALPVAGLMAPGPGEEVAARYEHLDRAANNLGCTLHSPLMTLSFMALLVIPALKLSDLGLFDGEAFRFTDLIVPG